MESVRRPESGLRIEDLPDMMQVRGEDRKETRDKSVEARLPYKGRNTPVRCCQIVTQLMECDINQEFELGYSNGYQISLLSELKPST